MKWWKCVALERLRRAGEMALMSIAWRLPRPVVYWCAIRVGAHATQGAYSGQVVPELTFMDAVRRWGG